jgi:hypothetical protein
MAPCYCCVDIHILKVQFKCTESANSNIISLCNKGSPLIEFARGDYVTKRIFKKNSPGLSNERNCRRYYVSALNLVLIIPKFDYFVSFFKASFMLR